MRIKILFDCRCCQIHKNRGIDNYFQGIISSLLLTKKVSASLLISQDLPFPDLKGGLQSLNILKLEDFNKVSDKWDFLFKGDFFDVPLSDAYPISVLQHCENIVGILYDLIPYLFPQNYLTNPVWVKRYCGQIEAAKYASHVFCISRQTFLHAKKYLMKANSELDVIYAAIPQFQNDVKKNTVNSN